MSFAAQHTLAGRETPAPRVLAVNTDAAIVGLLAEWLAGCTVVPENAEGASGEFDIAVVDVPFPRRGGLHILERVAKEHPRAAVIVISSSFFADVRSDGGVARALRVAGVLPKPFARDALLSAVERARRPPP